MKKSNRRNRIFLQNINFYFSLFFFLLFSIFSRSALGEQKWKLIENKEMGSINACAPLLSFSLKKESNTQIEEAKVKGLIFEEKDFLLTLIDVPSGKNSLFQSIIETSSLAGINGGYFKADRTPLGLLVKQGRIIHPQERANILSGFLVSTKRKISLLRVGEPTSEEAGDILQAGPFLLDQAYPVKGLDTKKSAYRSFVATTGNGTWMIGIISPVTLQEASQILYVVSKKYMIPHFHQPFTRALNLDGGSSCSFMAKTEPTPFFFREDVCVRNFLGLEKK